MFEKIEKWVNENVNCCACGVKLGTENAESVNMVELKKVATWIFPVFGRVDIPGYEPRALAFVCDECQANNVKIRHCIEWEGSARQIIYHDVDGLKDSTTVSHVDYYFGKLFRRQQLLRKAAENVTVN
jgi:hypothetical protein